MTVQTYVNPLTDGWGLCVDAPWEPPPSYPASSLVSALFLFDTGYNVRSGDRTSRCRYATCTNMLAAGLVPVFSWQLSALLLRRVPSPTILRELILAQETDKTEHRQRVFRTFDKPRHLLHTAMPIVTRSFSLPDCAATHHSEKVLLAPLTSDI